MLQKVETLATSSVHQGLIIIGDGLQFITVLKTLKEAWIKDGKPEDTWLVRLHSKLSIFNFFSSAAPSALLLMFYFLGSFVCLERNLNALRGLCWNRQWCHTCFNRPTQTGMVGKAGLFLCRRLNVAMQLVFPPTPLILSVSAWIHTHSSTHLLQDINKVHCLSKNLALMSRDKQKHT